MGSSAGTVVGVDGCRAGWVVVTTGVDRESVTTVAVVATIDEIVDSVRAGRVAAAGIDMPIGLATNGARRADADARRLLGPRRSSLFPTPPRAALDATDYADARTRCRAASGKGLSVQAYHLLPKMRELAAVIEPWMQPAISEVHPETSFAVLRNAPCAHPKTTAAGRAERVDALRAHFADVDTITQGTPRGAKPDDVLDALVAAWTARRIATGTALVLGDDDARDDRGLRLTIVA